ncbi:MAG: DNA translocase FtsK 4TM domain-containing protein, partial [Bryobacteraceae bacterium]
MNYLGPTRYARLNEAVAFLFLIAGLFVFIGLVSYHPLDPSWNTVTGAAKPVNLTGRVGAFFADFFLQSLGLGAYAVPMLILLLGWMWIRSAAIEAQWAKVLGAGMFLAATCTAFALDRLYDVGLRPDWWKLEPAADTAAWRNVETVIQARDPYCRGVVLLGQSQPMETLLAAFRASAGVAVVKGFAVGRTLFEHAARAWLAGRIDD